MRKLKTVFILPAIFITIIGVVIFLIITVEILNIKLNIKNTDIIILKYNNLENNFTVKINNKDEIKKIEKLFINKVIEYDDSCWCFFTKDISITFVDNTKKVTLYPALDGKDGFKVKNSNKFITISEENNMVLLDVLDEYGFILPVTLQN